MRALERLSREAVADRDVEGVAPDELKARHSGAKAFADHPQEVQRVLRTFETDESRRPRARIGKEPERSGGDYAERPLGADEKAFHVVAGIVLAQLAQRVDYPSVGENSLDAGDEVARIAVGDHGHAAGVG